MNPYDRAHELARAIRESEEFQVLAESKKRVERDPHAKKMLDDFRRRQWEMETRRIMGEEITEGDMQSMQSLQAVIQEHAEVREYVEAEYRFSILYSDIQKILSEAVGNVINTPEGI